MVWIRIHNTVVKSDPLYPLSLAKMYFNISFTFLFLFVIFNFLSSLPICIVISSVFSWVQSFIFTSWHDVQCWYLVGPNRSAPVSLLNRASEVGLAKSRELLPPQVTRGIHPRKLQIQLCICADPNIITVHIYSKCRNQMQKILSNI